MHLDNAPATDLGSGVVTPGGSTEQAAPSTAASTPAGSATPPVGPSASATPDGSTPTTSTPAGSAPADSTPADPTPADPTTAASSATRGTPAAPTPFRDGQAAIVAGDQSGNGRTVRVAQAQLSRANGFVAVYTAQGEQLLGSAPVRRSTADGDDDGDDDNRPVIVTLSRTLASTTAQCNHGYI